MNSHKEPAIDEHKKTSVFSDQKNIESQASFPHLQRILPPSQSIERENVIGIDAENFNELVSIQMDPEHPLFSHHLCDFMLLMEKIRLAVQSNLGLSALERESHETQHPIWVKKGNAHFPVETNGEIKSENVLYDSEKLASLLPKNTPKVLIIKDTSNEDGLSILYHTKFRSFSLHIDSDGKVVSSLNLNWKTIYDDLSPEVEGQQQALRSFTPWQRHSESNFFNGRSTDRILTYLTTAFPAIFMYDSKNNYRDSLSESLDLSEDNAKTVETDSPNLYLTLDASLIEPTKACEEMSRLPILAVVRRHSPLMGNLIQLVPALYEDGKLHLVLHGHQSETEIQTLFSCDFEQEKLHSWKWKGDPVIVKRENAKEEPTPVWKSLHLLKHSKHSDLIGRTSAAPMVRASDAVMRKVWLSGFDIPTLYTEMITIADIFNIDSEAAHSPKERLENFYYNESATSSFRRLCFSEYELSQAAHFAVQVAVPHESDNGLYFWGEDGENIARTTRMALKVILEMVPDAFHPKLRLAVNMCCPAASIERLGGGFGLCNKPDYVDSIIQSIKEEYPTLHIEFKTLMLSHAHQASPTSGQFVESNDAKNPHKISFEKNKCMSERLSTSGADGLVWQGKPRNEEVYSLKTVLDISKASQVRSDFKFGYSGMVATLEDDHLLNLGYEEAGSPHYSVEAILKSVKEQHDGELPADFEVMLGRVLLGSPWLLLGRHATDQEIILMALLQSFMLQEFTVGAGPFGMDLMQIQVLYNIRHLANDELRDQLMATVFEARSANAMINALYEQYLSLSQVNDREAESLLKPSTLKIKVAIQSATSGSRTLFSDREKALSENQTSKKAGTFFGSTRIATHYASLFTPLDNEPSTENGCSSPGQGEDKRVALLK